MYGLFIHFKSIPPAIKRQILFVCKLGRQLYGQEVKGSVPNTHKYTETWIEFQKFALKTSKFNFQNLMGGA